ncbi:MAG: hypothetical protein ACE5NG_21235, partial [bacterium]
RNAFNNDRQEGQFKRNYRRIFKLRFPHMDTVNAVMRHLDEQELEALKTGLVRRLIEKKVFHKFRFLGKYFLVVVDGTRVMNVKKGHCAHCLYTTSKKGKVSYFHNVLEAKLVCENGFCISLGTEWIENPEGEFDKQDCERKAFVRLAERLKKAFPRLPICIVADALYPNQPFFDICQKYGWQWIVTFKDGNLPSVWEEVVGLKKRTHQNTRIVRQVGKELYYTWINDIEYRGHRLHWFECVEQVQETSTRFVYVSNLKIDYWNVLEMTVSGRLRWKIENEGFNIQKNLGYGLTHKYSRTSMQATKNYYQCMQIAHLINQLLELSDWFQSLLTGKMTLKHLWNRLTGALAHYTFEAQEVEAWVQTKCQFRFG